MYISSIKFSIWCDFIERNFLDEEFVSLIDDEIINGATSNPAIFNQAFLHSSAYKQDRAKFQNNEPKEIYEELATEDIRRAAKKLLAKYEADDDGFVSIEIDPFLANDVQKSVQEGRRLFRKINMPNVMIKVPATQAGFEIMQTLMSDGIHVNATLIFSPTQAKNCLEAMKKGTENFYKTYKGREVPKGVISVFVSRFDRKLDTLLEKKGLQTSMVGIMNATKIYNIIENVGLENVRTLFASTGVKGDTLLPEYYVEKLLYPNSINTAPLDTINAFVASGKTAVQAPLSNKEIENFFDTLLADGIEMKSVYDELMQEGMVAFEKAFDEILNTLKSL